MLKRCLHVALLISITSIVFSNTLDNTYHLDSIFRVQGNTEIDEFWPPARFFTDIRTGSSIPQIAEYRPMMPLSHAINSEIAKATDTLKLTGFHVGNIAIHIGSAVLVYFLFCVLICNWGRIPESEPQVMHYSQPAFAAALMFAVHPIAGSAINYIAARDLLLMVFFFLASMLVYVGMRRKGDTVSGWLSSLLLLSLAILSKQAAIVGFGLVFLFEWILTNAKLRNSGIWARTMLFSVPTAAYFLLRWVWITKQSTEASLRIPADIYYPLSMAKAHVFYYMRNFVWPFELRALARFDMVESFVDPGALVGLLFIISSLAIAWLLRKKNPLISFAILAYWLLFALTASIFPFRYVVTDYRQYLPLLFLCLIVSLVCFSWRQRTIPVILLAAMALYFSLSSYHINQHWKTEESFWQQSVRYGAVALAHSNYALVVGKKDEELAEKHYLEALRQKPSHVYANINLGMLYIHQQRTQEGLKLLKQMVARNPKWALTHYWLSRGLKLLDQKEESLKELRRAADLDPRRLQYQYEAAEALQAKGDKSASIPYLERLININPDYQLAGFMLGFAYQKLNDNQRAISEYNRFLATHPGHAQGHFNIAYVLMEEGECSAAIAHFETVLTINPQYREVHLHLSKCYQSLGDEFKAAKHEMIYKQESQD